MRGESARVAVVDYGVGNLRSVERALLTTGASVEVTGDPAVIHAADGVILPGVGAFGAAADALDAQDLTDVVRAVAASGRPLLGVCLGHQLLFEWSDENGGRPGLGVLRGRVVRLGADRGKVPQIGWNGLRLLRDSPLTEGIEDGSWMYFVHSYAAECADGDDLVAECDYGGPVAAVCGHGAVFGTQFHPEKSGAAGLRLYANFVRLCTVAARA